MSKQVSLEELLKNSDVVAIHISSDEENRNWFDKVKFDKMKDEAILLNSARPWLVDEEALKWALDNKLAGAWFDFEVPFTHSKLVITNHLGGTTVQSRQKSELLLAEKIKRVYGN